MYYNNVFNSNGKIVLFFHGVYEDLGSEVLQEWIIDMGRQWGVHVLLVEYPGYGEMCFDRGITTTTEIKLYARTIVTFCLKNLGL
jgi:hypothetical protein